MNNLIQEKIDELVQLAQAEGDINTEIILHSLSGARNAHDDGLLAVFVQKFTKEVLLPKAQKDHEIGNAIKN
jgi:hypothetical protein